jgi:hypothetical protein
MSDLLEEWLARLQELLEKAVTETDPQKQQEITSEIWRVLAVCQRLRGDDSDLRSPELP